MQESHNRIIENLKIEHKEQKDELQKQEKILQLLPELLPQIKQQIKETQQLETAKPNQYNLSLKKQIRVILIV